MYRLDGRLVYVLPRFYCRLPRSDARDGKLDVNYAKKYDFMFIIIKVYPYLWNEKIHCHVKVIPLK